MIPIRCRKKKEEAIRYAKEIKHRTNIKSLCSFADLSRAAFYKSQQKSAYNELNDRIINYIKKIQKETCYGVGYRPMTAMVNNTLHMQVNKKRIHRIMDENNLLSSVRRRKYSTEQYKQRKELKANRPKDLLKRNFFCGTPRNHFVVDITYLFGLEKMYYLNTIVDLFNREIVAWKISEHPDSQLCVDTLVELSEQCNLQGSIIHSDGGTSYDNKAYMAKVNELGMTPSMSFGDCYDNSAEESVNAIIKTECLYNRFGKTKFKNRRIRCAKVLERIEEFIPFYNNKRRKAGLGWETPVEHLQHNPRGTLPVIVE